MCKKNIEKAKLVFSKFSRISVIFARGSLESGLTKMTPSMVRAIFEKTVLFVFYCFICFFAPLIQSGDRQYAKKRHKLT